MGTHEKIKNAKITRYGFCKYVTGGNGSDAMHKAAVPNVLVYIIRFGCFNVISEVFTQKAIGKNDDFFLRY